MKYLQAVRGIAPGTAGSETQTLPLCPHSGSFFRKCDQGLMNKISVGDVTVIPINKISTGDLIVMLLSRKPHQKFEIFVPPVEVDGQEVVGGDAGYGLVLVLGAAAASAGSLAQFAARVLAVPGFKSQMILRLVHNCIKQ